MRRFALILMCVAGCAVGDDLRCAHSSECNPGALCRSGQCEHAEFQGGLIEVESNDLGLTVHDTDAADTPTTVHPCGSAEQPAAGQMRINEVYAHVAQELAGDANGDGERDAYDDEFVEVWNVSAQTLRLDGVQLYVGEAFRFAFDDPICLRPSQAIVVFSGGTPKLEPDVSVVTSQSRLALSNQGGTVSLRLGGQTLDAFHWPNGPATSWQRWPEDHPRDVVAHSICGSDFSPGKCCDGASFETGCLSVQSQD